MNKIEETASVVELRSDRGRGCLHCDFSTNPTLGISKLTESINHYIETHGYYLLHIGQETDIYEGNYSHATIAILGSKNSVPEIKKQKFKIDLNSPS